MAVFPDLLQPVILQSVNKARGGVLIRLKIEKFRLIAGCRMTAHVKSMVEISALGYLVFHHDSEVTGHFKLLNSAYCSGSVSCVQALEHSI